MHTGDWQPVNLAQKQENDQWLVPFFEAWCPQPESTGTRHAVPEVLVQATDQLQTPPPSNGVETRPARLLRGY